MGLGFGFGFGLGLGMGLGFGLGLGSSAWVRSHFGYGLHRWRYPNPNQVILEIRLAGNYRLPGLGRVGEGEPEIPPELVAEIETLLARNRELRGATLSPHGWSAGTWAGTFVEGEYVGPHASARTWKQEL